MILMARDKHLNDALARLAAAEDQFLQREFLAPVVRGAPVQVRIAGIICSLEIQPADFEGWGVFRPTSHTASTVVGQGTVGERERHLESLPLVRLMLAGQGEGEWRAVAAHRADSRFRIEGMIPVRLIEEAQLFEVIETRFDGAQFWYSGPDARRDPATAAYLRQQLELLTSPDTISRPGLTAEERTAYALNYWPRYEATEGARRSREEQRLRNALEHAGAELKEFIDRPAVYTVTYEVDGQRHVSAVAKKDLSVQVAGICLGGEDQNFDLQSLVGVI